MMTQTLGWLLGLNEVSSIDELDLSLGASWAQEGAGPFWVFFGVAALLVLAFFFYANFQPRGSFAARMGLATSRGLLLALLFVTLADPILRITSTRTQKADIFVIVDGTDSMNIEDRLPQREREAVASAVGLTLSGDSDPSRIELVKALFRQREGNLLEELAQRDVNLQFFLFDGNTTSQLRKLAVAPEGQTRLAPDFVAEQLTTTGQVTAIGSVLADARQQASNLAGVVLISDFANNSGPAPIGDSAGRRGSPAAKLNVPLYTLGVGALEAADLLVDLQTQPKIRKAENTVLTVSLKSSGLEGQTVNLKVYAQRLSGDLGAVDEVTPIGEKSVVIATPSDVVEFPFQPKEAGRFRFVAEADPVEGEIVEENNSAFREATIIDDYVRLMYVAYEPTWEWRFVKEVFYRDKTVGMQGFRTFLASSDPRVRESNELFLPTLTPKRSEFFANDVIFLDDMPAAALSPRFTEMVREFVSELGGGLVVIAGPRFGPRELLNTPLAEMLPVTIDPQLSLKSDREFRPRLTSMALTNQYPFMRLGETDHETLQAWDNIRGLECYQPVAEVRKRATVLAEHPTDFCADGKTPQPLIAIHQYGKGEVVYLAFNETWRLRRAFGEKYYRNFWSPLIDRLGLSHALGNQKRFVPRLDRPQYRVEDEVIFTVQAYDENYEPLTPDKLNDQKIVAEMTTPGRGVTGPKTEEILLSPVREGTFEVKTRVYTPGKYSIRVKDPVTQEYMEYPFEVTGVSAERRNATRDLRLQMELASETEGKSYDLTTVRALPGDIRADALVQKLTNNHPLWSTPLWFILGMVLMLGEWLSRKMMNLS